MHYTIQFILKQECGNGETKSEQIETVAQLQLPINWSSVKSRVISE